MQHKTCASHFAVNPSFLTAQRKPRFVRVTSKTGAEAQCHSICQSWLWGLPKKLSFHSPAGRVARNERGGLALGLTHVFRVDSLSPSPSLGLRPSQREDKSTFAKYIPGGIGLTPIPFNLCSRHVGQVYNLPTFQRRMPAFPEFVPRPRQVKNLPHMEN